MKQNLTSKVQMCAGLFLLAGLLTGCETTGLSVRDSGKASYSHFVYQAARDQPSATTPRPLRRPIRLAVAQIGEVAPPTNVLAALRSCSDTITSVIPLPFPGDARPTGGNTPDPDATANRLAEICRLARSLGAAQVFVFGGTIDTRASRNAFAPLDVTIAGSWLFPSAGIHAEGKAAGVLIDAESGVVRFQVEAEQRKSGITPSAFRHEKTDSIRMELRDTLAASLTEEFIRKLREQ